MQDIVIIISIFIQLNLELWMQYILYNQRTFSYVIPTRQLRTFFKIIHRKENKTQNFSNLSWTRNTLWIEVFITFDYFNLKWNPFVVISIKVFDFIPIFDAFSIWAKSVICPVLILGLKCHWFEISRLARSELSNNKLLLILINVLNFQINANIFSQFIQLKLTIFINSIIFQKFYTFKIIFKQTYSKRRHKMKIINFQSLIF